MNWPTWRRPVGLVLLPLGATVAGAGLGNGVENLITGLRGGDWTVSAGGTLLGLGIGLGLLGAILRSSTRHGWWQCGLIVIGLAFAGDALGGGLDGVVMQVQGQGAGFTLGAAGAGLGVGVAALGWVLSGPPRSLD